MKILRPCFKPRPEVPAISLQVSTSARLLHRLPPHDSHLHHSTPTTHLLPRHAHLPHQTGIPDLARATYLMSSKTLFLYMQHFLRHYRYSTRIMECRHRPSSDS